MKRGLPWMVGTGCAGLAMMVIAEAAKEQPVAPVAPAAAAAEKIVFTFPDDTKMQEFMKLWQQRQGIVLRMTVLQAYWNEEQTALAELNNKLTTDYKLDPKKNYSLDDKRRALIEHEAPPSPQPAESPKQ